MIAAWYMIAARLLLRCSRAMSIDVLYRMFHVVQYEKASVLFELNSAATCRDSGEQLGHRLHDSHIESD